MQGFIAINYFLAMAALGRVLTAGPLSKWIPAYSWEESILKLVFCLAFGSASLAVMIQYTAEMSKRQ